MKTPEYSLAKLAPPESNALAYPNHDRANDIYSMWMTGYTEDEVAGFMGIELSEVKKDLMYVTTKLSVRQIVAHNNDRERIMLQRQNSENFRNLMAESLQTPAAVLLAAGISPAGILKEYREATGLVQKAEPLLQINTQINGPQTSTSGGITSAEDVIRRVLKEINLQDDIPQEEDGEVIDAEVTDADEPTSSPDSNMIPDD